MALEAIRYSDGTLEILDQLLLPNESKYVTVRNTEDGWNVIKRMQVRGAPAIGVVACLSLAVELHKLDADPIDVPALVAYVKDRMTYLITSRPTAVNIADAKRKLDQLLISWSSEEGATVQNVKDETISWCEKLKEQDITVNKTMAGHGANAVLQACLTNEKLNVLTHCNTGSLATAGYGTALGVVRSLHERGRLECCYATETRPYMQGARLTAYELVQDKLPGMLIADTMVAALMRDRKISAVLVGADRVVANGDTANKIGTFQIALLAKNFDIPFYVVAPSTSIDLTLDSGDQIVIEQRPADELRLVRGLATAPSGIPCWNPAFDVTPAGLITGGIVTEYGVFNTSELKDELIKISR